jgi:hypothetical protein
MTMRKREVGGGGAMALAALLGTAPVALAQTTAAAVSAAVREAGVTIGVSGGLTVPYCCPDAPISRLGASFSVPVGAGFAIEGDWFVPSTSSTAVTFVDDRIDRPFVHRATRETTSRAHGGDMTLVYHFGRGRLRPFFGAGLSVDRITGQIDTIRTCEPLAPGGCDGVNVASSRDVFGGTDINAQLVSGVTMALTRSVIAFAAARIDSGVTPYGGVRVALTTRAVRAPGGPEVRVVSTTGARQVGRLVSLSGTEVVLRQAGRSVVLPIAQVQRVERVSHRIRNVTIASAIAGYVGGYLASCGDGDENDCWPEVGLLFAGIGAGAGAAIGAVLNRNARQDGRDVLFAAPRREAGLVSVAPVVTPDRAGARVSLRW